MAGVARAGQCSNNITIIRALAAVYQGIRPQYWWWVLAICHTNHIGLINRSIRANHWQHAPAELLARITLENRYEKWATIRQLAMETITSNMAANIWPAQPPGLYKIYLNQTKVEMFSRFDKFTPLIITDLARAWSRGNQGELFWLFVIHLKIFTINRPVPGDQNTHQQEF